MKIILLQDVPALGRIGDIKEVSGGYARNFLLPQRMAEAATDAAVSALAAKKARDAREKTEEEKKYRDVAENLKNTTLSLKTKIGERGKAFGSITAAKIREALRKEGIAVEKEWIILDEPIKTAGEHDVAIRFPHGIAAKVKVSVQPE